jgi:A/G-specific adenine glycosylase
MKPQPCNLVSECDQFLAMSVLQWQAELGRHDLPWQNTHDPYPVWLSEIMLQQTQVVTVLGYFERFLARFSSVAALAQATQDDVLSVWAGLGYYSRARNLHCCAQQVLHLHDGMFPRTAQQLQTLPGIGRSTASAIAALCFGERVAILDGNVKRVLTRYLGFSADLAQASNERRLWDTATQHLPIDGIHQSMVGYTQGMMDLGATVCTAKTPKCSICPLASRCVAKQLDQPECFPVKTKKLKRHAQTIWLLMATTCEGAVWLNRRPIPGVWAGLHCLPMFEDRLTLQRHLPTDVPTRCIDLPSIKHVLTHKDLHLNTVQCQMPHRPLLSIEGRWFDAHELPGLGFPAPIKKMLNTALQNTGRPYTHAYKPQIL